MLSQIPISLEKVKKEDLDKEIESFKKLFGFQEFHQLEEIPQQAIFLSPVSLMIRTNLYLSLN